MSNGYPMPYTDWAGGYSRLGQQVASLGPVIDETVAYSQLKNRLSNLRETTTEYVAENLAELGSDMTPSQKKRFSEELSAIKDPEEFVEKGHEFELQKQYRKQTGVSTIPMWGRKFSDYKALVDAELAEKAKMEAKAEKERIEQKAQARQKFVTSELSQSGAGGQVLGTEQPVHPRYQAEGGSFTEQDILAVQKPATTREDAIANYMERYRLTPSEEPPITSAEERESLALKQYPSALDLEKQKLAGQRESRLQDMTDYQAERIKIAWRNAFLRERGQNINVATDSGKFKKDMHDAYIASAAAKAKRLPALYTPDGYPTGAVWSEQDQADFDAFVAANIAKAVDMGNVPGEILMEANKGEIVRRTAPGTYTTRPQSLVPSPAPAPAKKGAGF